MDNEKELLKKYFKKHTSVEENKRVREILKTRKGDKALSQLAENYWSESQADAIDDLKSEELFNSIIENRSYYQPNQWRPYVYRYVAAAVLFIAIVAAGLLNYSKPEAEETITTIETIHKQTTRGQKSTLLLSDGSRIILNSESSISYPKSFTDSSRQIHLKGEAFFEVAKDSNRPFTVFTSTSSTTALGTSFNINAAKGKVSLATGKVKVTTKFREATNQDYFLAPGQSLVINSENKSVMKSTFDSSRDLSWKKGVLYFDNTSFDELLNTLEIWYDVKFDIINPQYQTKRYTGEFDNASLEHVLRSSSFTLNFNYEMNGKQITISKIKP